MSSSGSGGTTGTSSSKSLAGEKIHFITVAEAPNIKSLWKGVVSDFESKTGAKVNLEFVKTTSLTRIIQLLQAGNPPEVAQLSLGSTILLHNKGVVRPLDDVLKGVTQNLGQLEGAAKNVISFDNHAWLIPFWHNVNSYNYRSDLSDIVPDTWDKALQYAQEVDAKKKSNGGVRGTYVPITGSVPGAVRLYSWALQNQVSYSTWNNGKLEIEFHKGKNRTRMVETLKYLQNRQQYSAPGAGAGWGTCINIIQSEKAASTWYGGVRPKNAAIRNGRSFAKDIEILPGMPKKTAHQNVGSTEGFMSFKNSNTKAADAFIQYVAQKDFLTNLMVKLSPIHNIPVWPDIKTSDKYIGGIKGLDLWKGWTMDQFKTYQNGASKGMMMVNDEDKPPNPFEITYRSPPIYNLLGDVLQNGKDPGNVIDKYGKKLQQNVDKTQNS